MVTCNDCIYKPNCYSRIANGMGDDKIRGGLLTDIDKRCKGFKNKADFVPVVRCSQCKHYNEVGCANGFGWREQFNYGQTDEQFCSYGERK